jgi:PAS domain S-box-containing protein
VITAAKAAATPIRVLLVGEREEDFFLIREILERNRRVLDVDLEHARSIDEAKGFLQQKPFSLVLFEYEAGDAESIRLMAEFRHAGVSLPFILLTEDANEAKVAELIEEGMWNCIYKSELDDGTLMCAIRSGLAIHSVEKERDTAEELLRKLSSAVEQSADTVLITDREGKIEYVNPAFETLSGYSKEQLVGNTPRLLRSGEQSAETYQELWRTLLSGEVYRGIFVNRKKNGELYYAEESICPVRNAAGEITHFIANGRDLTERRRLEGQLVQAQKMDAIGRLAGGVAHDFNNLLTIITSYAELALDAVDKGSPLEAKVHEILLAAKRAAELTRQLLAFSRKQTQLLRIVDLNEVVGNIAKLLPRLIGEDIEFSFCPGEKLAHVRIDPLQIEQVLMNLAANARDAMPQGGHLRIETSDIHLDDDYIHGKPAVVPKGHYTLITVSDDGSGIPKEVLPHIFEPFYTSKPAGKGTGLGLATVYGIVKQNKGFIWVYSEAGCGTVFKIYLPCVTARKQHEDAGKISPEPMAVGSETILLVEDEQAVRCAAADFLRMRGYDVIEACDGQQALIAAQKRNDKIDLLITDVVMPNLSGGELGKELRNLRPAIEILFVSGYAGQTVLDHNVVNLETNFLQKPYSLKQLAKRIRTLLDQHPATLSEAAGR